MAYTSCFPFFLLYTPKILIWFFIALTLVGGKFKLAGKASIVEKQAWNKFLIPNVKIERLRYFNNITRGVYESAFVGKQTGFQAYLDGQRRFRYGIKSKCDALQNIYSSYQEGLIPKQNICWKRYNDFPSVAGCSKAD